MWPLRLGVALVFIVAGVDKFMNMDARIGMFDDWGIPLAEVTTPLVAFAELFGGIGIFLGVLPRFSAAVLAVVMLTALLVVKSPLAFNDYRIDLMLLAATLTIVINGPGRPTVASVFGKPWLDIESAITSRLAGQKERPDTTVAGSQGK